MADTYPKDTLDNGQNGADVSPRQNKSTVVCDLDVPTPNGVLVLKLHRFSDDSGFVQVNRKRFGKHTETIWIDVSTLPEVIDSLQKVAVEWAQVGKDGRT